MNVKLTRKELEELTKNQLIDIILTQQEVIEKLIRQNEFLQKRDIELEERIARLEKNSQTSSKPPSQDPNGPKRNQSLRGKSGLKPGGQKGHPGTTRRMNKTPDLVEMCLPESGCPDCGENVDMTQLKILERRQEIEIPEIRPTVREFRRMGGRCRCGHCLSGKFPKGSTPGVQIGPVMKSFLIYLNTIQQVPYQRLTDLTRDLFNFSVCKRTIENALEEAKRKGEPLYKFIMTLVKTGKWVGSDETGTRVNGNTWWEWVWQNDEASYYAIDKSRGYDVVKTHFGEDYAGILCHDCWSAQNKTTAQSGHQQCISHIQRELNFLIEKYRSKWAHGLKKFLIGIQKGRDRIWDPDFDPSLRQKVIQNYQNCLAELLTQNDPRPDVLRLQKRIRKHQKSMLVFLENPDIPSSNNSSERAVRIFKIKQKISGCFRSQAGAKRFSILLSICETAKKQKMNLLQAIQSLLNGTLVFQGAR